MTGSGGLLARVIPLVWSLWPVSQIMKLKPFLTTLALLIGAALVISALALIVAEFIVGGVN